MAADIHRREAAVNGEELFEPIVTNSYLDRNVLDSNTLSPSHNRNFVQVLQGHARPFFDLT